MNQQTRKRLSFIINLFFWALILALFYFVLKDLLGAIVPFLIAIVIAALLQRPIRFISKKTKLKKKYASSILVTFTFFIIGFLVFVLGAQLIGQLASFIEQVPEFTKTTLPQITKSLDKLLEGLKASLPADFTTPIENATQSLTGQLQSSAMGWAVSLGTAIASFTTTRLPFIIVSFIITIVATFFISMDYDAITGFIYRQLPKKVQEGVSGLRTFMKSILFKMFKSYLTIMLITFAELSIGLTILGVQYSIILAAIISIVDILPILGVGTVLIPWAIISLLLGNWGMALGLVILYAVITVIRNIVEPRIVSINIGLHPVITLISMYIGLQIMGIAGMFLFPMICITLVQLQKNGTLKLWKE